MLLHGYRKFMKFAALQPAAHFDDLNRKRGGIIARDGARQIRFYCAELIFVYLPKDNLVSGGRLFNKFRVVHIQTDLTYENER
jgi:hypothetical protein